MSTMEDSDSKFGHQKTIIADCFAGDHLAKHCVAARSNTPIRKRAFTSASGRPLMAVSSRLGPA